MIEERKSLSMAESLAVLKSVNETEKNKDAQAFIKKFSKIDPEKATKLREALEGLDILKLKPTDISKIIDLLPEDAIELTKILTEVSLEADETNKILDAIKQNK